MPRARPRLIMLGAAALAAAAVPTAGALAGQAEAAKAKTHTVVLTGFDFKPDRLTAKARDRVRFVWKDGIHNVVSTSGPTRVDSGAPAEKDSLIITLKRGTYRLLCEPHRFAGMVMTIRAR